METRVGFIGLGVMGQPMAGHLAARHNLIVYNRTPERAVPLVERGARLAENPAGAAAESDILFLMLSNDQAVREVVEGPSGVLSGLAPGTVIVDHSTISPDLTRHLAEAARMRGADWCDAPVTGGDIGARNATLTIMVGGRDEAVMRIRPLLELLGQRIVHVGAVGQGQTLKLVANLVSALNLMAASEGLAMGMALGLKIDDMATVMNYGSAQSFELSKVLDRWTHGNFIPGFSVENRYKDLRLALELAERSGFPGDLTQAGESLYRQHANAGFGAEDEASYIKRWMKGE